MGRCRWVGLMLPACISSWGMIARISPPGGEKKVGDCARCLGLTHGLVEQPGKAQGCTPHREI